jgi:hypothetical protein
VVDQSHRHQRSYAISSRCHSNVRDGRGPALKRATVEVPHAGDTVIARFRGSFTRLGEGPLEPGDDGPVFMMPLAGVVRDDLEDVPRELETAFQIPHVQSRLEEGQRSECERHRFMWFGWVDLFD